MRRSLNRGILALRFVRRFSTQRLVLPLSLYHGGPKSAPLLPAIIALPSQQCTKLADDLLTFSTNALLLRYDETTKRTTTWVHDYGSGDPRNPRGIRVWKKQVALKFSKHIWCLPQGTLIPVDVRVLDDPVLDDAVILTPARDMELNTFIKVLDEISSSPQWQRVSVSETPDIEHDYDPSVNTLPRILFEIIAKRAVTLSTISNETEYAAEAERLNYFYALASKIATVRKHSRKPSTLEEFRTLAQRPRYVPLPPSVMEMLFVKYKELEAEIQRIRASRESSEETTIELDDLEGVAVVLRRTLESGVYS